MGCGESKHVVTGNTISRKSSRARGSRRGKTLETTEETTSMSESSTRSLVKEASRSSVNQDIAGAENSMAVADGEGKAESEELKKEEKIVENEKPAVEGVALDDRKLSEKTKEETVGGEELVQETRIETVSETKLAEESKGEEAKEDALEDKKLDKENKQESGINGESETVKEDNLVKETETAETTEAEVSSSVKKE